MATRGHLGGLSRATGDAALILDAAGKDVVIIETVGVGQDEVEIVRTADVSIVTLVPGTGDDVQALKAGIMEIADIFVVNKADREGADRLVSAVEANLSLQNYGADEWRPPIVKTVATPAPGIDELRPGDCRVPRARRRGRQCVAPPLAQRVPAARAGRAAVHGAARTRRAARRRADGIVDRHRARASSIPTPRRTSCSPVRSLASRRGRDADSARASD